MANDKEQRLRILLIEDNETNRLVAQCMLTKLGYKKTDITGNGLEEKNTGQLYCFIQEQKRLTSSTAHT